MRAAVEDGGPSTVVSLGPSLAAVAARVANLMADLEVTEQVVVEERNKMVEKESEFDELSERLAATEREHRETVRDPRDGAPRIRIASVVSIGTDLPRIARRICGGLLTIMNSNRE